ncbi:armadillo repeat-containing protein 7-like isoform X1 [Watersipora subatra]|uniref:armadillo repeat-containing protein 7-like isoform X1 n=1 Tax=Watersipora subatra TaxID=2589382 RepID=UPI00355BB90E
MFSSKQRLAKRTGQYGIGRLSYLQSLVQEFQSTESSNSKREILANLANFAYDPINYDYLRQLNVLDMFLDVLADKEDQDPSLKLYALTGICNSALDKRIKAFYIENGGVKLVLDYLNCDDSEMLIQAVTSLMYLVNNDSRKDIMSDSVKLRMAELVKSSDTRVKNLATIFMEDYIR